MSFWTQFLNYLELYISEDEFLMWIKPLQYKDYDNSKHLLLSAQNGLIRDYVLDNYGQVFRRAFDHFDLNHIELKILVDSDKQGSESGFSTKQHSDSHQQSKPIASSKVTSYLNTNYQFDNFIEGHSNQIAYAAAIQVAQSPGTSSNPLFIYGGVGLGKTHLMHAVGNQVKKENPDARVLYVHTNTYVKQFVDALRKKKIDDFKAFYNSLDVLLVDDIQFLSGKDKSEEEFFHLFNQLFTNKSQIILTCDRYPKNLENLEDRLKSRFSWGLTVPVEPPELETRVAILENKAQAEGIDLSNDLAFYVGKHILGSVRDLEGALSSIKVYCNFRGKSPDLQLIKEALKEQIVVHASNLSVDNIQRTVCEYYNVSIQDLLSKKRTRSIARPRQLAMALAKEFTQMSLPEIGKAFGGRDHTTVLHACKKVEQLKQEDSNIEGDWRNLIRRVQS